MARVRYRPPAIDELWLKEALLMRYPSHKTCKEWIDVLSSEYLKLWRLVLSFPEKRVVAPGCIMAVAHVHQDADRQGYFRDSMEYFQRFVSPLELAWRGDKDINGTVETISAYQELFQVDLAPPWRDMTKHDSLRRSVLRIV